MIINYRRKDGKKRGGKVIDKYMPKPNMDPVLVTLDCRAIIEKEDISKVIKNFKDQKDPKLESAIVELEQILTKYEKSKLLPRNEIFAKKLLAIVGNFEGAGELRDKINNIIKNEGYVKEIRIRKSNNYNGR